MPDVIDHEYDRKPDQVDVTTYDGGPPVLEAPAPEGDQVFLEIIFCPWCREEL